MLQSPSMPRWTNPSPSMAFAEKRSLIGRLITTLKDKEWFMAYLVKWLWYNSDDGENETDFIVEDVLYHYAHRESAA